MRGEEKKKKLHMSLPDLVLIFNMSQMFLGLHAGGNLRGFLLVDRQHAQHAVLVAVAVHVTAEPFVVPTVSVAHVAVIPLISSRFLTITLLLQIKTSQVYATSSTTGQCARKVNSGFRQNWQSLHAITLDYKTCYFIRFGSCCALGPTIQCTVKCSIMSMGAFRN